jgi:hypothetical protein
LPAKNEAHLSALLDVRAEGRGLRKRSRSNGRRPNGMFAELLPLYSGKIATFVVYDTSAVFTIQTVDNALFCKDILDMKMVRCYYFPHAIVGNVLPDLRQLVTTVNLRGGMT